ncbi:MAG: hypothetical protein M1823_005349 [Watsoniomyces obsoletus]|nr:MAG: hypothetical protein M1823_005349 [Watsoniomyces obsoletus]
MEEENQAPTFLLLLPPLRATTSYNNLSRAYRPTLSAALHAVATTKNESTKAAILEIALACPDLEINSQVPRSQLFGKIQSRLASVYKLICVICVEEGIRTLGSDGVDARVLTLAWTGQEDLKNAEPPRKSFEHSQGIITTLPLLAVSQRPWSSVFTVDDDAEGEQMRCELSALIRFYAKRPPAWKFQKITRGEHIQDPHDPIPNLSRDAKHQKHHHVAVGGTFDHLHAGHKLLLTMTAFLVEPPHGADNENRKMTVGISGGVLLYDKAYDEYMKPWVERYQDVSDFMTSIMDFSPPRHASPGPDATWDEVRRHRHSSARPQLGFWLDCVEISDPYGPTITLESISALVVSAETSGGGQKVNEKRREMGWPTLEIFEVDVLSVQEQDGEEDGALQQEFASKISSTAIREQLSATAPKRGMGNRDPS